MVSLQLIVALFVLGSCGPQITLHQAPLYGNFSLGYYYVNILVGTPPQRQSLIVDTGSAVFGMPCQECRNCSTTHINPKFDSSKSSTARALTCASGMDLCGNCWNKKGTDPCQFSSHYAEGSSLAGFLLEDTVSLEEPLPNQSPDFMMNEGVSAIFGCITTQTNLFLSQKADGLLGLAPNSPYHLAKQVYKNHYTFTRENYSFSVCMSQNGGTFTVGGLNSRLHSDIVGVNLNFRKDANLYSLNVSDIHIGSVPLNLTPAEIQTGQGVFIDTGATYSYFQYIHYNKTLAILNDVCLSQGCTKFQGRDTQCFRFPQSKAYSLDKQIQKFPNISLRVGNSFIHWPPHKYMIDHNRANREICLGFTSLNRFILGLTWLRDRDVYFDMQREQVIVFDANCQYNKGDLPTSQGVNQTTQNNLDSETGDIFEQLDVQALVVSLVIVIVFAIVVIFFVFRCLRRRRNLLQQTTMTNQSIEEDFTDQISMADITEVGEQTHLDH